MRPARGVANVQSRRGRAVAQREALERGGRVAVEDERRELSVRRAAGNAVAAADAAAFARADALSMSLHIGATNLVPFLIAALFVKIGIWGMSDSLSACLCVLPPIANSQFAVIVVGSSDMLQSLASFERPMMKKMLRRWLGRQCKPQWQKQLMHERVETQKRRRLWPKLKDWPQQHAVEQKLRSRRRC